MTAALLAVSALLVAAAASLITLALRARRDRRAIADLHDEVRELDRQVRAARELPTGPSLDGKTVVVNTRKKTDDQTFRGVLHAQYADRWTLRGAVVVTPLGEHPVPNGDVIHVPVENIAFAQEIQA